MNPLALQTNVNTLRAASGKRVPGEGEEEKKIKEKLAVEREASILSAR